MITRAEVSRFAYEEGMSDRTVEKDYVLGRLLMGISDSMLRSLLAFKGGTAIKKIYFPDYRYSEDLDFTLLGEIEAEELVVQFKKSLARIEKETGLTFNVPEEKIERRKDSLTLYVQFIGPLLGRLGSRDVKIDFTFKEFLIFPLEEKSILMPYSDSKGLERKISVYSLEEILTEKLCALAGRTEPRDLFDAHFLLDLGSLDYPAVGEAFTQKAAGKNIDGKKLLVVLKEKEKVIAKLWETRLARQVMKLPPLKKVMREVNRNLRLYKI